MMSNEHRVADQASVEGCLAPSTTKSTAAIFTFALTVEDQGDLTEEQAISEARTILANPAAYEWLPWKASTTRPDA